MKHQLLFLLCLLLIIGCKENSLSQNNSTQTSIVFSLPSQSIEQNRGVPKTLDPEPTNIVVVWKEPSGELRTQVQAYSSGSNTVTIPKGVIATLGLTAQNEISTSSRSISSAITTLGSIGVITNNLNTLPINDDAANDILLGELAIEDENYASSISADQSTEAFGYDLDTLGSFGLYDESFRKSLNVDINENGVFDYQEDFQWSVQAHIAFHFHTTEFSVDSLDDFQFEMDHYYGGIWFNFGFNGLTPADPSEVSLSIPPNSVITDNNGTRLYEITNPGINGWEGPISGITLYAFGFSGITPPGIPYGDYILNIGSDSYNLQDIYFPNPANNYEGMLFPIFSFERDEDENFGLVKWQWKIVKENEITEATSEEMELFVNSPIIYLGTTGKLYGLRDGIDFGVPSGTIDVTSYNTNLSDNSDNGLRMSYRDSASNLYTFWVIDAPQ
ncbi:MAG: hypothetical protein JEY99_11680 [Spirochaetales bacterium]|nr:hypothetical protein [Spirochaetales bacterium]